MARSSLLLAGYWLLLLHLFHLVASCCTASSGQEFAGCLAGQGRLAVVCMALPVIGGLRRCATMQALAQNAGGREEWYEG